MAAAAAGDGAARARLIELYAPLVASVARPYRVSGGVTERELLQEGAAGVLEALRRYDPALGVPFWAYASWWVRHSMQRLVAELRGPVVLSDRALRALVRVREAQLGHEQRHGRGPSTAELVAATGLDATQIERLLAAGRQSRSLSEPRSDDLDHAHGRTLAELLADPRAEEDQAVADRRAELSRLRRRSELLTPRERDVLRARHGLDGPEQTLQAVAERLGVTAERVRQIEQAALGKLRGDSGRDALA